MTEMLFQDDAYLKRCESTVVRVDEAAIVIDRTVFYPLGGGQPGDTGLLRRSDGCEIRIADTHKGDGGEILHHAVDAGHGLIEGDVVEAVLDWDRRYAHMRMHTGLHLLGSVLNYGVTGGSIGAERSRLDFDMQDTVDKDEVTAAVNALIEADHVLTTRWITDEDLDAQPDLVRTMSVKPPRGSGRVRLLEIPGVDLQPCGGTHVARTGEIGRLRVSKVEKKGKHNRRVAIVFDEGEQG